MGRSKEKSSKKKMVARRDAEKTQEIKLTKKAHKEAFDQLLDDAVLGVKKK